MTKSEINKLIEYIDDRIIKRIFETDDGKASATMCSVNELYDILSNHPVESEKTCGPDYKAMYEVGELEMENMRRQIETLQVTMEKLRVDHARYVGAVAAMETIFGRKFDPKV